MKQIYTLFGAAFLCLLTIKGRAQFYQDFENSTTALTSNCWSIVNFAQTNVPGEVISGHASLYSNPPTSSSGTRDVYTPYLNITSTPLTVSFKYKLNSTLSGQAVRTIEVGLADVNGAFTSLRTITFNGSTPNQTAITTFSRTFSVATPIVRRLVLRFGGSQGDGNTRIIIDDLTVNANAYYGPTTNCNTAPIAANNTYTATSTTAPYIGSSVLNNDSDPNSETLTITSYTQPVDGTVVMNPDGTFTFTPKAGFTGSFTTFTYTVNDNGYTPLTATATVYIYFTVVTTLPVQLLRFSGAVGAKANLSWSVAANESGQLFEVQRSSNGSTFQNIAVIFMTENSGDEQYQFSDAVPTQSTSYRLKIVNKDGTTFYSPVVLFKTTAGAGQITLLQNPVQKTLRFTIPAAVHATAIVVYNMSGTVVYSEKAIAGKYNNSISLPLQASLPGGTYILQVITDGGSNTKTFIKQ